ncbi:hypothetical protein KGF54_003663 [Candida jiufengensis]|uniref:uncharacterized protein n=1 Tax=Candida jiufengensis TaxID=497108 RepID=UPI0022253871|nr:uncharacterized protein KGF54_003663 [Candida jiufengensis]KAI5952796.1 hypothetical protein KGF54_003663 [Candida jiufengensis]
MEKGNEVNNASNTSIDIQEKVEEKVNNEDLINTINQESSNDKEVSFQPTQPEKEPNNSNNGSRITELTPRSEEEANMDPCSVNEQETALQKDPNLKVIKSNESTNENNNEIQNSTIIPDPPASPQPSQPKNKKRLTLQERLALAAKGKKKSNKQNQQPIEESTPSPIISSQNVSTDDIPSIKATEKEEEINNDDLNEDVERYKQEIAKLKQENNILLQQIENTKTSSTDKNLSKIIKNKDEQIEQLLKEGEALSHKELKLNESIKKLKTMNSDLEYDLNELIKKNDESLIRYEEVEDFLKNNKLKTNQQLFNKFKEINENLESTTQKYESLKNIENKYNELIRLNEETNESKSSTTRELSNLKIEHDMLKKQQELELSSKEDTINSQKNEIYELKQNYNEELRRLEDKIENLRINNSSTLKISDNKDSIEFDEFKKLSETHHNLQKQYLSSQENFKLIESNLNMKIDTLTTSLESFKKSKNKLSNDLIKSNQSITLHQKDIKSLKDENSKLKSEINDLNISIKLKNNDIQELNDKLDKFKSIHNNETNKLNTQIDNLNETIESLRKRPDPLKLDSRNRDNSMGSGLSWNDIRLGESSTTPAIHRDYPMFESQSSFTEVGEDEEQDYSDQISYMHNNSSQIITSNNSFVGNNGNTSIPLTLQNNGNNLQLINKMSSNIRRLEIELNTMKDEYSKLMNDKQQIEENLLENLTKLDEMNSLQSKINELEIEISKKSEKEQTMLELIGEKSEQVEELKNDVLDLKELLKTQVQQMIELQGL